MVTTTHFWVSKKNTKYFTEKNLYINRLTTEEILNATDAELNTWKSLKQVTKQMTSDELEKEQNYWSRLNPQKLEERKKRVFRSIYGTEEEKGDYLILKYSKSSESKIDTHTRIFRKDSRIDRKEKGKENEFKAQKTTSRS